MHIGLRDCPSLGDSNGKEHSKSNGNCDSITMHRDQAPPKIGGPLFGSSCMLPDGEVVKIITFLGIYIYVHLLIQYTYVNIQTVVFPEVHRNV